MVRYSSRLGGVHHRLRTRTGLNDASYKDTRRGGTKGASLINGRVMKTCNGGYCSYKIQNGSMYGCTYSGNCAWQCPKTPEPSKDNFDKEWERQPRKNPEHVWTDDKYIYREKELKEKNAYDECAYCGLQRATHPIAHLCSGFKEPEYPDTQLHEYKDVTKDELAETLISIIESDGDRDVAKTVQMVERACRKWAVEQVEKAFRDSDENYDSTLLDETLARLKEGK